MTGDSFVNLVSKKILGLVAIKNRFFDYLKSRTTKITTALWPDSGVFTHVTIQSLLNDTIGLIPAPHDALDNAGNFLRASAPDVTAIPFENAVGDLYHIGETYAAVPDDVEENARTGVVQYKNWVERVGTTGQPDDAAAIGLGIRFRINALTDPGAPNRSCAGRTAIVWMRDPLSSDPAVAIETCAVTWSGVHNEIQTVGKLGQVVVSVDPAEYRVAVLGPRISFNVNLSADPATVYIGTVLGNGPAAIPAVFDTTGQRLLSSLYGGLADVTEFCAHWDRKICVTADGADVDVPQITVKDAGGARVFFVDEDGDVTLASVGANSPIITLQSTGGHATLQNINGVLTAWMDTGPFFLSNSGDIESDAVLQLKDFNTGALIPFSAAAPDNAIDALLGTNLLGAINRSADQERLLSAILGPCVLTGFACSNGGGLNVTIDNGTYLTEGRRHALSAGPYTEAVPDASTRYVYLKAGAPPADPFDDMLSLGLLGIDDIPLCKVVTAGGVITSITDLRTITLDADKRLDITCGTNPAAHFRTLSEAVAFVREYKNATGTYRASHRIRVLDEVVELDASVPIALTAGLHIEGAGAPGVVKWGHNSAPLFSLDAADDVTIENLEVHYTNAAPNAANPATRVLLASRNANPCTRLTMRNVKLLTRVAGLPHGFLVIEAGSGAVTDLMLDNCMSDCITDFAIFVDNAGSNYGRVRDCIFRQAGAAQATPTDGIQIQDAQWWEIRGGLIVAFGNDGIALQSSDFCRIIGVTTNGNGGYGVNVDATSLSNLIDACHCYQDATGAVQSAGNKTQVHGCDLDPAAGVGVNLTAASTSNLVTDNQFNSHGTADGAAPGINTIGAIGVDNRDDV